MRKLIQSLFLKNRNSFSNTSGYLNQYKFASYMKGNKIPPKIEEIVNKGCIDVKQIETINNELLKWREICNSSEKCKFINKKAIFLLGPMGVGKSYYISNTIKATVCNDLAVVNSDNIMLNLKDYNPDELDLFYSQARLIAIALTEWLMIDGVSFIAEGCCTRWEELYNFLKRLKSNGFLIEIIFMEKPLEVVMLQASQRDRIISIDIVKKIYEKSIIGCKMLRENNKLKEDTLFTYKFET